MKLWGLSRMKEIVFHTAGRPSVSIGNRPRHGLVRGFCQSHSLALHRSLLRDPIPTLLVHTPIFRPFDGEETTGPRYRQRDMQVATVRLLTHIPAELSEVGLIVTQPSANEKKQRTGHTGPYARSLPSAPTRGSVRRSTHLHSAH